MADNSLFRLVENCDDDGVKELLDEGVDPNILDRFNGTALHQAASYNDHTITKILLEKGANPNIKDFEGDTPLHKAAYANALNVIQPLIKYGANIDIKNDVGDTPIDIALDRGYDDAIELFYLNSGAFTKSSKFK